MNRFEADRLAEIRRSVRDEARATADIYLDDLDRHDVLKIGLPPRGFRQPERFGGRYERQTQNDWEWFDSLKTAEKERIRRNWMRKGGVDPDEVDAMLPGGMTEWLNLTRRIDALRVMATGRNPKPELYGGLRAKSLIAGEPYDFDELYHPDAERAARHVEEARRAGRFGEHHATLAGLEGRRVEFFTDAKGIVHPIRATYEGRYEGRHEPEADYDPELDVPF